MYQNDMFILILTISALNETIFVIGGIYVILNHLIVSIPFRIMRDFYNAKQVLDLNMWISIILVTD